MQPSRPLSLYDPRRQTRHRDEQLVVVTAVGGDERAGEQVVDELRHIVTCLLVALIVAIGDGDAASGATRPPDRIVPGPNDRNRDRQRDLADSCAAVGVGTGSPTNQRRHRRQQSVPPPPRRSTYRQSLGASRSQRSQRRAIDNCGFWLGVVVGLARPVRRLQLVDGQAGHTAWPSVRMAIDSPIGWQAARLHERLRATCIGL